MRSAAVWGVSEGPSDPLQTSELWNPQGGSGRPPGTRGYKRCGDLALLVIVLCVPRGAPSPILFLE